MMRTLTDHIVDGDVASHQVAISVLDEPGAGGANHEYHIEWLSPDSGNLRVVHPNCLTVCFQNGPIKEVGVNGVTQESLLAILIDRLRSFQNGPYACLDNQATLDHLELALKYLKKRTSARINRGVEGTHQK